MASGSFCARAAVLGALGAVAALGAACRDDGGTGAPYRNPGAGGAGGSGDAGGAGAGEPAGPPVPLSILNWNTHNFFNDKADSNSADETVLSASAYRRKREQVAAVLKPLDADVVVLAEVEHLGVLDDLDRIELAGAYPTTALIEGNDPRGIDVGVLSKVPIDKVVSHADEPFTKAGTTGPVYRFARDCLELHLTHGGRQVIVLAIHYRSKSPPDDPDKRLAEAQHTRGIADALAAQDPTAAIVVLGDFNDLTGSPAFKAVAGGGASLFEDAASTLPAADQWSYDFNGQHQLIDHQMANPVLRAMLDAASVQLVHGAAVDDASDHAPTMATYAITAAR